MPSDFSVQRRRLILLFGVFSLSAFLVGNLPPGLSGPVGDRVLEMFLFIPGGLAVIIVAGPILAPQLLHHVLSRTVSPRKARLAVLSGVLFVVLCIIAEWFVLWPKLYRGLYFNGLPLALGFCCSAAFLGLRAMKCATTVQHETPIGWGVLSTALAASVSIFFVLSSYFTYASLWIVGPAFVCLFYSAKTSADVAIGLLYMKGA